MGPVASGWMRMRFSCLLRLLKVSRTAAGLNWVLEDGCLQMCVLRVHSQYFVPACVCVFSRVRLNMCVLIPCRPADRKKGRRRQCLLFPLVAIATVHSGAAIISLITCSV